MLTDGISLRDHATPLMERGRIFPDNFDPKGVFKFQLVDALGNPLTDKLFAPNGITTTAKNEIFNTYFNSATAHSPWYIGLIDNTSFSTLSASDLMSSHTGWSEFSSYSRADTTTVNRVDWGQGTASSAQLTNAAQATFTFTASGTVAGIFITSGAVKGGTTGTLWSTALFSAALTVATSDILRVTYTVSA